MNPAWDLALTMGTVAAVCAYGTYRFVRCMFHFTDLPIDPKGGSSAAPAPKPDPYRDSLSAALAQVDALKLEGSKPTASGKVLVRAALLRSLRERAEQWRSIGRWDTVYISPKLEQLDRNTQCPALILKSWRVQLWTARCDTPYLTPPGWERVQHHLTFWFDRELHDAIIALAARRFA